MDLDGRPDVGRPRLTSSKPSTGATRTGARPTATTWSSRCNYLHITDNLLDPSHVAWVHPGSFAGDGSDETALQVTIGRQWCDRVALDARHRAGAVLRAIPSLRGNCDRKQQYEVRYPSNALIKAYVSPAGTGGEDQPLHPDAFLMDSFNFLTPVDETTTRYFWFQMRNVAPGDADVSRRFAASVRGAFEEDRVILQASQARHGARRRLRTSTCAPTAAASASGTGSPR